MTACSSCDSEFEPQHPDQKICDACDALAHPVTPSAALRRIGNYTLAHELGSGRYATSWLAESAGGGGVILKLLRAYAPDTDTVKRFLDEARKLGASGKLEHPALARVLDAGVHLGGSLFLVYESGGEATLADELRGRGRVVAPRAIELCAQVADGLHALHKAGFAHFDLKPANVGVTKDDDGSEQAVLLDGVTEHLLLHAGLRETGMLPISTAAYLSPELAAGAHADGRSDLYSVAVMLYQLLSGRLPFTGHTAEDLIESHKSQRPLKLRDVGRRVHGELEALLQKALAKDPNERFPTGADFASALRKVAPIADQATDDHSEDDVEDPLQVTVSEPPEPEIAPPPKPRADAQVPERAPTPRPSFTPRGAPSIVRPQAASAGNPGLFTPLRIAIFATALLSIGALVFVLRPDPPAHSRKKRAPAPSAAADASTPASAPLANAAPSAETPHPIAAEPAAALPAAPPQEAAPAPEPVPAVVAQTPKAPPAPKKTAAAAPSGPHAMLAEAQKQLAHHQAKPAMRSLFTALDRTDISSGDRARATKLMAEAETLAGNKDAAADWYRKYLRLTDDPAERVRVVRLMQALR